MAERPKILLLFPNPIATIPGGLTYVAKRFARDGWEVATHINTFGDYRAGEQLLADIVEPFAPDVVGLSYATFNVVEVYRLQRELKTRGYFVIAGGNHPSIRPEEPLRNGADLVFKGEAELSIDDFTAWWLAGRPVEGRSGLRGVSYLDAGGTAVHNPKPDRILNLDGLGEMDFSSIDLERFRVLDGTVKGLNVVSCGRGCPHRCGFCSHSDWYRYAKRSPDSIVEEMARRHERHGIRTFWLSDETFTVSKPHVYEFCEKVRASRLPVEWMIGTRVSSVDEDLLKTMRDSGLAQITYGVESADDETLLRVRKGYDAQRAYETVKMTGELGIPMYVNLMTGFPWETPEHVRHDVEFIEAVSRWVYCFQLYGAVIPYPDTCIYDDYHEQEGFTDWWLQERFQNAGMVIYQNVANPYKVSTYFQRNLYDDTYVAEDYFFRFTPEYKRAVARMGLLIGWKAIQASTTSPLARYRKYGLGWASRAVYGIAPGLEKRIVGSFMHTNKVHETRLTGRFIRT